MSNQIIAIIAAHPDDEILGCGGTAVKHANSGDEVNSLILSEGITGRDLVRDASTRSLELSSLKESAKKANSILGIKHLEFADFPDQRMDDYSRIEVTKKVESFLNKIKPSIVYTHFCGDLNKDHRITSEAVITACRPSSSSTVKKLLFFETVSSTEWRVPSFTSQFDPNWFVDISDTLDQKIRALKEYSLEMRDYPHPRSFESIKYLARWRGSIIGIHAAEAFVLGRGIQ